MTGLLVLAAVAAMSGQSSPKPAEATPIVVDHSAELIALDARISELQAANEALQVAKAELEKQVENYKSLAKAPPVTAPLTPAPTPTVRQAATYHPPAQRVVYYRQAVPVQQCTSGNCSTYSSRGGGGWYPGKRIFGGR